MQDRLLRKVISLVTEKLPFKKFVKRDPVIAPDKNKKIESTPAKPMAVEKAVVDKKEDK